MPNDSLCLIRKHCNYLEYYIRYAAVNRQVRKGGRLHSTYSLLRWYCESLFLFYLLLLAGTYYVILLWEIAIFVCDLGCECVSIVTLVSIPRSVFSSGFVSLKVDDPNNLTNIIDYIYNIEKQPIYFFD